MSKGRYRNRGNKGTEPTREMWVHIMYRIQPEDIFDEDEYIEKMLLVRYRIIGVFAHSIDPVTKRGVRGNYLIGIGGKLSNLKHFMNRKINPRGVVTYHDLPECYQVLSDRWRQKIINRVMRRMVDRQISYMFENNDLWRLEAFNGDTMWEISQSVADRLRTDRLEMSMTYDRQLPKKEEKPRYRDERNHHGKPSRQSRRRNRELRQAPGISVGASK